jgi:hypothetical protein
MCDYSLMSIRNRLATEGEELITHRFQTGSIGLLSCSDLEAWRGRHEETTLRRIFRGFTAEPDPSPVVCIPPGARLQVDEVPKALQEQHHVKPSEEVTFTQISNDPYRYRDALRFDNGATVRVQSLPEGLKVKVMQLALAVPVESETERVPVRSL